MIHRLVDLVRQHCNAIFYLCLASGLIALLWFPVTFLDVLAVPKTTSVLPGRAVLSYQNDSSYTPPEYVVCQIDDDAEGHNSFGVYHPTDLAVTVHNLKRLGITHLFLGTHLHWPDLEEIDNATLHSALKELNSCIVSVPLRRTTATIDCPDYLVQSSVSIDSIDGKTLLLPRVNNVSLAPTFRIPENTIVGFSQLESEEMSPNIPLLAVWQDRVIFSSLLLERMHQLNLQPSDISIVVGKRIQLGNTGNTIPINEFGYYQPVTFPEATPAQLISSEITGVQQLQPSNQNAIVTAAGLQADAYRAIDRPVVQLKQLAMTPVVKDVVTYHRSSFLLGLFTLMVLGILMEMTYTQHTRSYIIRLLVMLMLSLMFAWIVARVSHSYLPVTPLFVALLTGAGFHFIILWKTHQMQLEQEGFVQFEEIANNFVEAKSQYIKAKRERKKHRDRNKKRLREERRKDKMQCKKNVKQMPLGLRDSSKTRK